MSCHPDLFELLLFKASSAPHPPPAPLTRHPSFSLSTFLSRFVTLSSTCLFSLQGGKTLLSHHPAADRHAKVVLWVIASLIDAVLSAHTRRPLLMPRSERGGRGLCRLNLLPDCSSVLIKQASVVF